MPRAIRLMCLEYPVHLQIVPMRFRLHLHVVELFILKRQTFQTVRGGLESIKRHRNSRTYSPGPTLFEMPSAKILLAEDRGEEERYRDLENKRVHSTRLIQQIIDHDKPTKWVCCRLEHKVSRRYMRMVDSHTFHCRAQSRIHVPTPCRTRISPEHPGKH